MAVTSWRYNFIFPQDYIFHRRMCRLRRLAFWCTRVGFQVASRATLNTSVAHHTDQTSPSHASTVSCKPPEPTKSSVWYSTWSNSNLSHQSELLSYPITLVSHCLPRRAFGPQLPTLLCLQLSLMLCVSGIQRICEPGKTWVRYLYYCHFIAQYLSAGHGQRYFWS